MRVARTQRRRWRDTLAPWDLSPHQARALRVVCEREGVRLSDLAEALHIAPRSATEVADGLQERGLVERTADPGDRRAVMLGPTGGGRAVPGEVGRARGARAAAAFAPLDAGDRAGAAGRRRALGDAPRMDPRQH